MVESSMFGMLPDGSCAMKYTIPAGNAALTVTDFGATVLGLSVPDRDGNVDDIVLGFSGLEGYFDDPACYGATIGPVANRTRGAELTIGSQPYALERNDGPDNANNLHSSLTEGLHKRLWERIEDESDDSLTLACNRADGELGLPGNRRFTATFSLAEGQDGYRVDIRYRCESDKETFVNMTNHTYFNLAGHASGSALHTVVAIDADSFLPIADDHVPDGRILPVAGTPFDFRTPKALGQDLGRASVQLERGHGIDHCFCVRGWEPDGKLRHALSAHDLKSGRTLDISVTTPGIQLYPGNWLDDPEGKDGTSYIAGAGFAAEAEYFPDCAHHPSWPQPVCTPKRPYEIGISWMLGTYTQR